MNEDLKFLGKCKIMGGGVWVGGRGGGGVKGRVWGVRVDK